MSLQDESILHGHADTYRAYNTMRLQDETGSGKGYVTYTPDWIVQKGEGVFWKADGKNQNIVYLFHPARVFRMLRTAVEVLPFTHENGDC